MSDKLERIVLGMIIKENLNLVKAEKCGITSELFKDPRRGKIFETISVQTGIDNKLDFLDLRSLLGESFHKELNDCLGAAPLTLNFEYFADEFLKGTWKEKISLELSSMARKILRTEEFQPLDEIIGEINLLSEKTKIIEKQGRAFSLEKIMGDLELSLEKRILDFEAGRQRGISTGITLLDRLIIGFCPAKLYVLAARTSVGKTTIAVNFMRQALFRKKNVLFFSVEMTEEELAEKLLSLETGVSDFRLTKGDVRSLTDVLADGILRFKSLPGFITSRFENSIEAIERDAKLLFQDGKLDFVIVDYVQELNSFKKFQSRTYELADIIRRLKALAMRFKIPVLALCQINREGDSSNAERPLLSHLKDSDSLALASDCVMLLWKDLNDYWLQVVKARKGCKTGLMKLRADLEVNRFSDFVETNGELLFY